MANTIASIYRKGSRRAAWRWDCHWSELTASPDSVLGLGQPAALPQTLLRDFLRSVHFSRILLQECDELP